MRCNPSDSTYNASEAGDCIPKPCELPLSAEDPALASYESCTQRRTNETCQPDCRSGYSANGTIALVCSDIVFRGRTSHVFDAGGVHCNPHRCSGGPNISSLDVSMLLADFTGCNSNC
eukprot:gene57407-biopygen35760